jgi:carboxyl-terminal processing protease
LRPRRLNRCLLSVFLIGVVVSPLSAQITLTTRDKERHDAFLAEQRQDWFAAAASYENLLRKNRDDVELRAAFVRSLRHLHLARRHRDPSYETVVQQMSPSQALDIYQKVLLLVPSVYIDQVRTGIPDLFASGVQELLYALEDATFVRLYLPGATGTDAFKEFRARLTKLRDHRPGPTTRQQARDQVFGVGQMAQDLDLPISKAFLVAVAFEMAAGACNALDEYTLFLTPGSAANEALGIDAPVGVGFEVVAMGDQHFISRVFPNTEAMELKLSPQDRLVRINGQLVAGLSGEAVATLLRGAVGTTVEIEVQPFNQEGIQKVRLLRQAFVIPSVEHRILDAMDMPAMEPIGYLRISSFQHSTVQEVREALGQLQTAGARGVILDLRGNGGGLFQSAISVAELFLPEGQVIVRGEGPLPQFNKLFPAPLGNPLTLPLAVLIDGDTASAAEVVVGALKDQNRARLFGQPTFGKGLIQCIIPVTKPGPAGHIATALKITVARFFTPGKQPVNLQGIAPHDVLDPQGDGPINAARLYLLGLLRSMNVRPPAVISDQ